MKHIIRSLKYLAALCGVYFLAIYLMYVSGYLALTPLESVEALAASPNFKLKLVMLLALIALYPKLGFITRETKGSTKEHKQQIINAFANSGFRLKSETEEEMIFVQSNLLKKVTFLFEDDIHVKQLGEMISIEGNRRGVAYVIYRLEGYIANSDRAQN